MTWPIVQLKNCARIVGGATPKSEVEEYWNGDIPWTTPKDLSELDGKFLSDTPRKITDLGLRNCSSELLPPNSVLFSSRAPIGHVAINTVPMATNQGFKSMVPGPRLDASFLYWWLKCHRPQLEQLGNGATFKEVSKAVVERIEIPLPPLEEQKRIAAILDQADELRRKRQRALDRLNQLGQAIFMEMFGGVIAGGDQAGFHDLASLMSTPLQNGAYFPKESYSADGVEMVHMSDAFYGIVERGNLRRVRCTSADVKKYALDPSDVLIARRSLNLSGAAKPCLVPQSSEPLIFESSFIRLRPDINRIATHYLYAYMSSQLVRSIFIDPYITQSTISGINQSNLARVKVFCPPLAEQEAFGLRIESIGASLDAQRDHANHIESLFSSLQYRAFRGELTALSPKVAAA